MKTNFKTMQDCLFEQKEKNDLLFDEAFFQSYRMNNALIAALPASFRHKVILSHTQDYIWFLLVKDSTTATQIHYLSSEIIDNIYKQLKIRVKLKVRADAAGWILNKPRSYPLSLWQVRHYSDKEAEAILEKYIKHYTSC